MIKRIVFSFFLFLSFTYAKDIHLSTLKALCFQKNTESCNLVASWYALPQNISENALKESKAYYQLSCYFGNSEGCYQVGNFYLNGKVGLKSINAAKQYFNVACLGKNALACFNLGLLYVVEENELLKSIYYLKKSCYFGYSDGCYNYNILTNSFHN